MSLHESPNRHIFLSLAQAQLAPTRLSRKLRRSRKPRDRKVPEGPRTRLPVRKPRPAVRTFDVAAALSLSDLLGRAATSACPRFSVYRAKPWQCATAREAAGCASGALTARGGFAFTIRAREPGDLHSRPGDRNGFAFHSAELRFVVINLISRDSIFRDGLLRLGWEFLC